LRQNIATNYSPSGSMTLSLRAIRKETPLHLLLDSRTPIAWYHPAFITTSLQLPFTYGLRLGDTLTLLWVFPMHLTLTRISVQHSKVIFIYLLSYFLSPNEARLKRRHITLISH